MIYFISKCCRARSFVSDTWAIIIAKGKGSYCGLRTVTSWYVRSTPHAPSMHIHATRFQSRIEHSRHRKGDWSANGLDQSGEGSFVKKKDKATGFWWSRLFLCRRFQPLSCIISGSYTAAYYCIRILGTLRLLYVPRGAMGLFTALNRVLSWNFPPLIKTSQWDVKTPASGVSAEMFCSSNI